MKDYTQNENLLREYFTTKDITVRNEIVLNNLFLVKHIVGKMKSTGYYEHEFEDLMSYGVLSLIHAIDLFDITKSKFSTYAYHKIYYGIIDELRKIDWVPRSVRTKIRKVKKMYNEQEDACNLHSLIKECGLSRRDTNVLHNTIIVSLNQLQETRDPILNTLVA
jgi:RNA polymerase sigma factor (sigma-70 family)